MKIQKILFQRNDKSLGVFSLIPFCVRGFCDVILKKTFIGIALEGGGNYFNIEILFHSYNIWGIFIQLYALR